MAKPSKLNKDTKRRLLESIAAGNYLKVACAYAGISYSTYRNWMVRGEHAIKGQYREFFEEVNEAIAEAEVVSVAQIKKAENQDWRAAAWMLERRHPERWANTHRVQLEVQKKLEATLVALESVMPTTAYNELLTALASLDPTGEAET